jgi:hypothetical protein
VTPGSNPPVETVVKKGDAIGTYATPTNGHSSGPHDHHMEFDSEGKRIKPTGGSPVTNGKKTSFFGDTGPMHPNPHSGDDWKAPN